MNGGAKKNESHFSQMYWIGTPYGVINIHSHKCMHIQPPHNRSGEREKHTVQHTKKTVDTSKEVVVVVVAAVRSLCWFLFFFFFLFLSSLTHDIRRECVWMCYSLPSGSLAQSIALPLKRTRSFGTALTLHTQTLYKKKMANIVCCTFCIVRLSFFNFLS